jgi:hypothetical protein
MRPVTVITAPATGGPEELRAALVEAFVQVQRAVGAGESVRFVVPAADLLGHGSMYAAAYANAAVGMARATAFEGRRHGWRVNVIAAPDRNLADYVNVLDGVDHADLQGQVVILGAELVGKVIP